VCLCFFSYTAACGPRSVRTATVRVRFSEAGEVSLGLSADPAALSRGGRTGTCRFTAREPVTVCRHNLGGRPEAGAVAVAARQTAGRRSPVEPPISRSRSGRRSPVGRLPAAHRSGRVSGIRPSDRRGPGPAGHRGRNVRSTGRCSYNLRITRRRADSCAKLLFSAYSYTNNLFFPSTQQPSSLTRFGCLTFDMTLISVKNSLIPCFDSAESVFIAT